jgi:hypothetical protein
MEIPQRTDETMDGVRRSLLILGIVCVVGLAGCTSPSNTGSARSDSWPLYFHNDLGFSVSLFLCANSACSSADYSIEIANGQSEAENVATKVANTWVIENTSDTYRRCISRFYPKYEHKPEIQLSSATECRR